jgi:SAM-dependent methyltransferase
MSSNKEYINIKLKHEYYLDKWLGIYELDHYKIWLFKGLLKILRKYASNGRVLDLGCAKGYFVDMLNLNGYSAIGADISLTALKNGIRRIDKVRADSETLPFKNCSFKGILAVHTLEHFPDPHQAVSEVYRVLKPGGVFLAITPDRDSPIAKIGCRVVKYTSLKNPYHVSLMNRKELEDLVRKAGFSEFTILPFHNGFLGAPFIGFIPIPISTRILIPFSHHQLLIAIK